MKLYNEREHRLLYGLNPDFYFDVVEEHDQLMSVLAEERLDGHNRYTQWMMELEHRMADLIRCIDSLDGSENDKYVNDLLCDSKIIEY
jgi:hypothetical protein